MIKGFLSKAPLACVVDNNNSANIKQLISTWEFQNYILMSGK